MVHAHLEELSRFTRDVVGDLLVEDDEARVRSVEPPKRPGVGPAFVVVVRARRLAVKPGEQLPRLCVGLRVPLGVGPQHELALNAVGDEKVGRLVRPEEARRPAEVGQATHPRAVGGDLPADVVVLR